MTEKKLYKVIISDNAKRMLGSHIRFIANVDKKAAAEMKTKIMASLRTLEVWPERYPFFNELFIPPNKYHKIVIEKRYLALYQIKDNVVYVDHILDCRQDYDWLIH